MQTLPEEVKKYLDTCKKAGMPAEKVIESLSEMGWDIGVLE